MAEGLTNGEIGERLGISLDGAKYHVGELLTRLNLDSREDIGEWYRASGGDRRRVRALAGLVALLAAGAVGVLALVAGGGGGPVRPLATSPLATVAVTPMIESTAMPTPRAKVFVDDTDRRSVAEAYEAMAWDDRRRLQRIPPPSVESAEAEAAVHRAGYVFGSPPASFEGVAGSDGCVAFDGDVVRAGDWVISSVADSATRRLRFEAHEIAPPEPANGNGPFLLRLLSLDGEVERSHAYERYWGAPRGTFDWDVRLPATGRWLAVATSGPNWGCLLLDVDETAEFAGLVSDAEQLGVGYLSMVASAERAVYFSGRLAEADTVGSSERQCVDADGLVWAASGEFLSLTEQVTARWSPTRRSSKVAWVPLHEEELEGGLLLSATLMGAPEHTYSYFERFPVQSATSSDGLTKQSMFITSPTPPRAGQWLIVVTARRANWGCFLLTLR